MLSRTKSDDKRITPHSIKSKFLGDDKRGHYTLSDLIAYHNDKMFCKLHGNIPRLYLTSQKYILLFLKKKYKMEDMELADLDYKFILKISFGGTDRDIIKSKSATMR